MRHDGTEVPSDSSAPRERPDQSRLARTLLAQSDHTGAFNVLREISRTPAADTGDLELLFMALRVIDTERRDRWLRRLNHRKAAKLVAPIDYARLLMIAGERDAAAEIYAALDPRSLTQDAISFCFVHFVETCQFRAAETLCAEREAEALSPSPELLWRYEEGLALSREWGLGLGDDFWRAAIERLTERTAPLRENYEPDSNCLLLCLAGTGVGGVERQADLLADAASTRSRAKVVMLSLSADEPHSRRAQPAYALRNIREFAECTTVRQSIDGFDELQSLTSLLRLQSLAPTLEAIVQLQPGVVQNCHQSRLDVLIAAVLVGVPRLVADLANLHPSRILAADAAWLGQLNKTYEHVAQFQGTRLVANSRGGRRNWARHSGLPQQLFHYVYNPFDAAKLGPASADRAAFRRSLGIPDGAPVVGGVFRLEPVKDPLLWVEVASIVARELPDGHFLLVGDGRLADLTQARVRDVGLAHCFHFAGAVQGDVLAYYQAMDVFLLASRAEGLPNVIIEAQHAGLPVVAVDVGGAAEAIASGETGKVVETRAAEALADAVISYLKDASQRERIAEMAPKLIEERFSAKRTLRAYETLYGWSEGPEN